MPAVDGSNSRMNDLAVVRLPAGVAGLEHTFAERPDLTVQVERIADSHASVPFPFVWFGGVAEDEIEPVLDEDPTVVACSRITETPDWLLYEIEWGVGMRIIKQVFLDEGMTIVDVSGQDGDWRIHLLLSERGMLSSAAECCKEYDIDFDVDYIVRADERSEQSGLTDKQYRALQRATELGYFDVPRRVTIEELADEFDVTHQALSERLRRGHKTLIESTLDEQSPSPIRHLE